MTSKKRLELIAEILKAKEELLSNVLDGLNKSSEYYTAYLFAWSEIDRVLSIVNSDEALAKSKEIWLEGEKK